MNERIIFAGTPEFAATHLAALIEAKANIVAVYTQPDRPAGRGHKLTPSPVKELALKHGIEVYTPRNFKDASDLETFISHQADLAIVVAYGLILPEAILQAPRLGCINVHASLLPKWRGAAPIQRALLSGQKTTGISIMQIVKALDAGAVLCTQELAIADTDTSGSLFERLATCGAQSLVAKLPAILAEQITPVEQDENEVTYAAKLSKDESPLNYAKSASELELQIRGLNPWPIATTSFEGTLFKVFAAKVLKAEDLHSTASSKLDALSLGSIVEVNKQGIVLKCAQDYLCLTTIQAPGKSKVAAADYARSKQELFTQGKCFE